MATMCHFWRITPNEFWDLAMPEYEAMRSYQAEWQEAQQRVNKRGRR